LRERGLFIAKAESARKKGSISFAHYPII